MFSKVSARGETKRSKAKLNEKKKKRKKSFHLLEWKNFGVREEEKKKLSQQEGIARGSDKQQSFPRS
jgi:hypothetical protein